MGKYQATWVESNNYFQLIPYCSLAGGVLFRLNYEKSKCWLLGIYSAVSCSLIAAPLSEEDALLKARQFYTEHQRSSLRSSVDFKLVYTDNLETSEGTEIAGFYVFNAGDKDGFVIVAGNDAVRPILGYSDSGSFPTENIPDNLRSWLDFYHKEIRFAMKRGTTYRESTISKTRPSVAPLITSKWDQGAPYNILCPYHPDYKENALTGCTATAMAQVLNYYEWPIKGTGVHSDHLIFDSTDIVLTVDYGETTYPWNDMLDIYNGNSTPAQDSAVALLSYHCGVAADMNYGVLAEGGSGGGFMNAGISMIDHLGYDPDLNFFVRFFYKTDAWERLLRDELDAARPILYSGSSPYGGHAFVCDGYDSNGFFHLNWGWSGVYNGYFTLTTLLPEDNDNMNSINGYSNTQYALMGIQKPDGVDKPSYMMVMNNMQFNCSKTFLSSVSTDTFSFNHGYWNLGLNEFRGSLGVALYQNGALLKCLATIDTIHCTSYTGSSLYHWDNLSLAGLTDGEYQLYPVFQPENSTIWSQVRPYNTCSDHVDISILGNNATIIVHNLSPQLILTDTITIEGKCYQNRKSRFHIPLKNNGPEFYSNLNIHFYSETNQMDFQDLECSTALIKNGESQMVEITGILKLKPGSYLAYAQYDSANLQLETSFKRIGVPFQITIMPEPSMPLLTINQKIRLEGGDTLHVNESFTVTSDIKNIGGYYDGTIFCGVFPATPGYNILNFGYQDMVLDSAQTKTARLTSSIDLAPGKYRIILYYILNKASYKLYSPDFSDKTAYSILPFTLQTPTSVEKIVTQKLILASNHVGEWLEIITDEYVLSADIYDLSGRSLDRFEQLNKLSVGNLKKGMYLLRITTNKGIQTIRFIK